MQDTNRKYYIPIQKPVFIGFIEIVGLQNQSTIIFGTSLLGNKILKVRNSPPTYTL